MAVLLRPLPFADASRLIPVQTLVRGEPDDTSNPDLVDWRASTQTVDRIAGIYASGVRHGSSR